MPTRAPNNGVICTRTARDEAIKEHETKMRFKTIFLLNYSLLFCLFVVTKIKGFINILV